MLKGPAAAPFSGVVAQMVRSAASGCFALAALALLSGCPLLLEDEFVLGRDTAGKGGNGGDLGTGEAGACTGDGCGGDSSGDGSGTGGSSGAVADPDGGAGGSGPPPSDPDAGNPSPPPPDAADVDPCSLVNLYATTHPQSPTDNCLAIQGWNNVEVDPDSSTTAEISYGDGDVCFAGTIDNVGWGATYNLTLAAVQGTIYPWNAASRNVSGFEFRFSGALPPPDEVKLVYSDTTRDYCRMITPSGIVSVPFDTTVPNCSSSTPGSTTPDQSAMTYIRIAWFPEPTDYAYDFCVEIRAIR